MKDLLKLVISFVFLIWFIASIIFMILSAKTEGQGWLVPVSLGQFLFVFGALAFSITLSERKNGWWAGALGMFIGASAAVTGAVYHIGSDSLKDTLIAMIPVFVGIAMAIGGLSGVLITMRTHKKGLARYTTRIEGKCIELKKRAGKSHTLYSPVYEITLNNETKRLENDTYSSMDIPQVGEVRELFIDEADLEGYSEPRVDSKNRAFMLIIFRAFLVGGVIVSAVSISGLL